jgi:divalent metal cation (Fe/Co/Zn/Cd) transporter
VQTVGLGIAVVAVSLSVNVGVSIRLSRAAKRTGSVALAGDAAHLGTDALTSAAVLVGLVLVDESLPPAEVDMIRTAIERLSSRGVVGYHELRTRRAGSRRYVDLHVQFREGTSLEDAHPTAHELQDLISDRLSGADVLIHLEPQDRVRPGDTLLAPRHPGVRE